MKRTLKKYSQSLNFIFLRCIRVKSVLQPDYPTPEEKRQTRVHKQYAKIKGNEIREETLYYSPGKEKK